MFLCIVHLAWIDVIVILHYLLFFLFLFPFSFFFSFFFFLFFLLFSLSRFRLNLFSFVWDWVGLVLICRKLGGLCWTGTGRCDDVDVFDVFDFLDSGIGYRVEGKVVLGITSKWGWREREREKDNYICRIS